MKSSVIVNCLIVILFFTVSSCSKELQSVNYDFDSVNNR